jgi:outer membrane lipoprotein-sorting protein
MTKLSRPGAVLALAMLMSLGSLGAGEDARALYERMRAELFRHQSYTAVYEDYSARGKNQEINAFRVVSVKCIQKPKWYCGTILEAKYSFPDQMTPGYQECYTEKDDLSRLVLPGAYRMLGVVLMFPEDPKAYYINGENLKSEGIWDFFSDWDRMLQAGAISAEPVQFKGQPYWLLTIRRGEIPDPDFHLDLCKIWVDPDTWFPMRMEYFRPGEPKAAHVYTYREVKLSAPLSAEDMNFQGLTMGWNLAKPAGGAGLGELAAPELKLAAEPAPDAEDLLKRFEEALQPIRDYTVTMSTRFRFHRLRLLKQDRYSYLRPERGFEVETLSLAANYILLGSTGGSRMFYAPSHDALIHLFPGGIYKVMGEQTFTRDDPRLFSSLGDNVQDLDFFTIRDRVRGKLADSEVRTARSQEPAGILIELKTKILTGPREPKIMRLFLDPATSLPLRVEFRGYDDPQGFCQVDFSDLKTNTGLTAEDILR